MPSAFRVNRFQELSVRGRVYAGMAYFPPAHFPSVSAPLSWLAVKSEKTGDRLAELEAQHEQWLKSVANLYADVVPIGKSEDPVEQDEEEEEEPEEEEEYDESGDGDDLMDELDTGDDDFDQVEVVADADRPASADLLNTNWL